MKLRPGPATDSLSLEVEFGMFMKLANENPAKHKLFTSFWRPLRCYHKFIQFEIYALKIL